MKKIGLLVMALVLALGSMGVGYALWSDTLYLDATVNTGSIGLVWTQELPYDDEAPDKDVSNAECFISPDGKTLTITVNNAYPCITYTIPIDLHNTGTIPVHTRFDMVGGDMNPAWINVPPWGGLQIHPCTNLLGDVIIHLDNTALQGHTYTVSYELVYWQYNELGPAP